MTTTYATCTACGQTMTPGNPGCTATHFLTPNQRAARVPHRPAAGAPVVCHDCNVTAGGLHHHNCDLEDCPICGAQAISCHCEWNTLGAMRPRRARQTAARREGR